MKICGLCMDDLQGPIFYIIFVKETEKNLQSSLKIVRRCA